MTRELTAEEEREIGARCRVILSDSPLLIPGPTRGNKRDATDLLRAFATLDSVRTRLAEVEREQREWIAACADGDQALAASRREAGALRAALRAVEWANDVEYNGNEFRCCPACSRAESEGHAPDCIVGRALTVSGEGNAADAQASGGEHGPGAKDSSAYRPAGTAAGGDSGLRETGQAANPLSTRRRADAARIVDARWPEGDSSVSVKSGDAQTERVNIPQSGVALTPSPIPGDVAEVVRAAVKWKKIADSPADFLMGQRTSQLLYDAVARLSPASRAAMGGGE